MKMTFRWFGEGYDSVPLSYVRQIPGLDGVVTSLLGVPAGEVWPREAVRHMRDTVMTAGLKLEVIESVNVHEEIKLGAPGRDEKIDAYIETMKRLAEIGIKVICYNFMPVLDWARSDLFYPLADGSKTMRFSKAFIANATPAKLAARYQEQSGGIALPGWEPERLAHVEQTLERYQGMDEGQYLENARYFIRKIIPWAEKLDIKMAVHADDPPWPVFGLPRLVYSQASIDRFLSLSDSPYHGLTLCTGSLGADRANDLPKIIARFTPRIHFAHVRNIKFSQDGDFYECAHPTPCGSLDMYAIVRALFDGGFDGYIRPDHGRMIWDETGRPGYGLADRAIGIAYLTGLWEAIARGSRPT